MAQRERLGQMTKKTLSLEQIRKGLRRPRLEEEEAGKARRSGEVQWKAEERERYTFIIAPESEDA